MSLCRSLLNGGVFCFWCYVREIQTEGKVIFLYLLTHPQRLVSSQRRSLASFSESLGQDRIQNKDSAQDAYTFPVSEFLTGFN